MNDMDADTKALCEQLQAIWYKQIPLSQAMEMRIADFNGLALTTEASLAPNVNVHGTAFAGSLYAIQALTGWGMMHLQLALNTLDASIVIASGQINYAKPVARTSEYDAALAITLLKWRSFELTARVASP